MKNQKTSKAWRELEPLFQPQLNQGGTLTYSIARVVSVTSQFAARGQETHYAFMLLGTSQKRSALAVRAFGNRESPYKNHYSSSTCEERKDSYSVPIRI